MERRPLQHILLVEDQPDIQFVARAALERVGEFVVRAANNGAEALALLASYRPDLILLDSSMPVMDGLQTLQRLKADPELAAIPVVSLSATADRLEEQRLREAGVVALIAKPFDPMELPATLRRIWASIEPADRASSG